MKRTILTALFALNALFCVNQMQAISLKKAAWGTGAAVSTLGIATMPLLGANAMLNAVMLSAMGGSVSDRDITAILGTISLLTLACAASAKYCYDKYKAQPE